MVNLILAAPNDLWAKLIGWFNGFIPNYGWTIVVITILLKLVLTPLDVWQRIISKKNTEKMAVLQPQIEKLNKRYANDKEKLNQKTMELYKKENYNVMGFCLPMLINMVLTLVIFITFFNSLVSSSTTSSISLLEHFQQSFASADKICPHFLQR